jgi:colanic acid/amylovoran biosynthesis protein
MDERSRAASREASAPAPGPGPRVCLMGASFETGNLGVSALAESSVKCILARWPDAQVMLLGGTRQEGEHRLQLSGREVTLRKVPVRFCKNVFLPSHFCVLAFWAVVLRVLPFTSLRTRLARRNPYLRTLLETHCFIDIAGGDSFSDIYGLWRLTQGFLMKLLPFMLRKDVVLFPQTYGPFRRAISRAMARYILKRARRVYSRDRAGLDEARNLLGRADVDGKVRFAPDVAFLLDPRQPPQLDVGALNRVRTERSILVGLNVSGLLYYGGYTGHNEFGLKGDYKTLIDALAEHLLNQRDTLVLLVPHVIPTGGFAGNVENDLSASLDVYDRLAPKYPDRIFVARGSYDHCQTKYIIGLCDFFIGTRMHSCIGALSQCIPAVGLAYSKKFRGVFETAGLEDLVMEMRQADTPEIIAAIDNIFAARQTVVQRLQESIPSVKQQVLGLLENLDS